MTIIDPPCFCANSVNYLLPTTKNEFDYYILGVLNSKLLNWYFAKQSTNSNVNGYEVDGLPIKEGSQEQQNKIISLVKEMLSRPEMSLMQEIDKIVYDIYGITEYEIPIVEG